ncbi:MAG: outer membrane protein assembly factor BamE [Pseudazoarcus pumilus]|nr:outer membrane protein assembly factor BamE [Pseudazoarcus pumilus]
MRSITAPVLFLAGALLLSGCSAYRIDVRQGNYVDQEMVAQLRKGMSRDQVRFVLGSPLVVDMFRENRWDYVYRFTEGWGDPQTRTLSLFFVDDKLDSVEGDVLAEDGSTEQAQAQRTRVVEVPSTRRR